MGKILVPMKTLILIVTQVFFRQWPPYTSTQPFVDWHNRDLEWTQNLRPIKDILRQDQQHQTNSIPKKDVVI